VVRLVDKGKVPPLITAESIIVALLVAYGSTIGGTLATLSKEGESIFGAVSAGLLISGLAITAFQSIYLLYKSIDISCDVLRSDERYSAGYTLFLAVLFGSGFYVAVNAFSILNYAMTGENLRVSDQRVCIIIETSLLVAWSLLVMFTPLELAKYLRKPHGRGVIAILILAIVTGAIEGTILSYLPGQFMSVPWFVWVILFITATFLWIVFARRRQQKRR
jgi:hypothetical protein